MTIRTKLFVPFVVLPLVSLALLGGFAYWTGRESIEASLGRLFEIEAGRSIEALDRDVAMALDNGQEDLARYAIKRLLPLRHAAEELERRRREAQDERGELGERLAEQEAEYQLLESRVQGHLARLERQREGDCGTLARELVVTDEDVELELLRRRQAAEGGG